ncbi:MAG: ATP phosphoribosyltransferase, partial [Cellvibrionales bacterium]|nr:ATP phosphoribosyltransferase [Cellvibrionales bacterium]
LAKCSLQTAGFAAGRKGGTRLRVASKFVNVARSFYAAKGVQADIIKLYGAMELAPMLGLVDEIVDIVDTGNTLRANGLVPFEHIADISTRFVVNKAAMRTRHALLTDIIGSLGAVSEPS